MYFQLFAAAMKQHAEALCYASSSKDITSAGSDSGSLCYADICIAARYPRYAAAPSAACLCLAVMPAAVLHRLSGEPGHLR
ncbi:MAG: hypothetical protein DUD39_14600 [Coriobacteriaceae bacterium]|nr:MAG: hypothetical protein DUD39_14600 [Coriobacteriaceae bacterium]